MSQILLFSFPKRFLEVGSSGIQEEREFPQGQWSLGSCWGGPYLPNTFLAPSPSFRDDQLGLLGARPCSRKLSAIWPLKESSNPPLIQREAGVERNLRASEQAREPCGASCPQVDPRRAPKIGCQNSASVCRCQVEMQRQRVWGKGEKNSFIALPGKGGPQQAKCLKDCARLPPALRKNGKEFYSKMEKNRFSERNQDRDKHAFFVLWRNLSHQSGVRRPQPDHSDGLLGYCLELWYLRKGHIDQRLEQTRKVPEKHHVLIIFNPQAIMLRVPNL